MKVLAVIPARGGSKGIVQKNLRRVAGVPLVVRTVQVALDATRVSRVVVSTDDSEIATTVRAAGAEVVERPAQLSGDAASSESALLHTLDEYREREAWEPDLLVFLQCTSPLTTAADIDGTIETLLAKEADSVLAVAPFHYFLWRDEAGRAAALGHDATQRLRRQDQTPQYVETGAVYVMRVPGFRTAQHRFFGKTVIHVTPAERRWEVDEPVDLQVAEVLARDAEQKARIERLPERVGALVMDFDGVFTDDTVITDQDGFEAVVCSRSDGLGIERLRRTGLPLLVISKERNPVVAARCKKMKLECLQGVDDKWPALAKWIAAQGVTAAETVYVGNDINDLDCLSQVGCPVAVADARPEVLAAARLVLERPGGYGAVREVTDLIIEREGEEQ